MNRFFRRNGALAAIEIAGRLPLLFTIGFLANSVGPGIYGNWALVLAAAGIVGSLATLGLSSAISRLAAGGTPEAARARLLYALRTGVAAALVLGVALFVWSDELARVLGMSPASSELLGLAGLLAMSTTVESLLEAYFRTRERIRLQAALVGGRTIIEASVVFVVFGSEIVSEDPYTRITVYAVAAFGLKAILLYSWLLLTAPRVWQLPPRETRGEFLRYGLPMIPAGLLVWLTTQGDRLVLGHTLSSTELGWYAFGAGLAWNLSYLALTVYPLLLPRASVLYDDGDHEQVVRLFAVSQRVYLCLFGGLAVALALLSEDVVRLTAGEAFAPAAPVLLLLSLAVGLEGLLGIYQWIFHLVRKPSRVLVFNIGYLVGQVSAVYVAAVLTNDMLAVAWVALAVVVVGNAVRYVMARRLYVVRAGRMLLPAIAALGGLVALAEAGAGQLPLGARLTVAFAAAAAGVAAATHATAGRRIAENPRG